MDDTQFLPLTPHAHPQQDAHKQEMYRIHALIYIHIHIKIHVVIIIIHTYILTCYKVYESTYILKCLSKETLKKYAKEQTTSKCRYSKEHQVPLLANTEENYFLCAEQLQKKNHCLPMVCQGSLCTDICPLP